MTNLDHPDVSRGSAFCVVEVLREEDPSDYLLVQEKKRAGRTSKWKNPGGRHNPERELDNVHGFRGTALREIREELDRGGGIGFEIEDIGDKIYEVLKDPDSDAPHLFVVFRVRMTESDLDKVEIFRQELEMHSTFSIEEVQKMVAHTENHPPHGPLVEHHALALREALGLHDPWRQVASDYN